MADMEKMMKLAEELGIKINKKSDSPGFFLNKNGLKEKCDIKDLLDLNFEKLTYSTNEEFDKAVEEKLTETTKKKRFFYSVNNDLLKFSNIVSDRKKNEVA